jgi:para-aminobenzoate synthetase/4-amino-4-deoxychorismate lyase
VSTKSDQFTAVPRPVEGPRPLPDGGVFETTLVVNGRPVGLDAHLRRLTASVRELYERPAPPDLGELVAAAATGLDLGRLRATVAPGPRAGLTADIRVAPVDERTVFPDWSAGAELAPVAVPGGAGAHKWADRRLLERAESDVAPALPLLVDGDGAVLEVSRANLFLVSGDTLVTPAADGRLLAGITRAQAIEAARALGMPVREQRVGLTELAAADEAFLTGAVRGVEPVRRCAGVAEWTRQGAVSARLAAELRRAWLA